MKAKNALNCIGIVTLIASVLTVTASTIFAGQDVSTTEIPKDEIKKLIEHYQSDAPQSFVHDWMKRMPPPATNNAALHKEIIGSLPPEIAKLRVDNKDLEDAVAQVLGPVLALYSRGSAYQIVVIRYPVPAIMFDTIATLVMSTGLLQRVQSDDALLGAVAHEIAHELNAKRLRDLRRQYQLLAATGDNSAALNTVLINLAEVELDCDAFAALTLSVLDRNPGELSKLLLAIGKDFHQKVAPDHPETKLRAYLISSIVPKGSLDVKPQETRQLLAMKSLVAQTANACLGKK